MNNAGLSKKRGKKLNLIKFVYSFLYFQNEEDRNRKIPQDGHGERETTGI